MKKLNRSTPVAYVPIFLRISQIENYSQIKVQGLSK